MPFLMVALSFVWWFVGVCAGGVVGFVLKAIGVYLVELFVLL